MRRRRKLMTELRALHQELDVLRAENARLRLDRQTPASLGEVSERTRAALGVAAEADDEAADQATTVLANAAMIRSSVLAVCEELQNTFAQLQRRLQTGVPPAELDRRVADRRTAEPRLDPALEAGPSPTNPVLIPRPQLEQRLVSELVRSANGSGANGRDVRANGANGANGHDANGHDRHEYNGHDRLAEGA